MTVELCLHGYSLGSADCRDCTPEVVPDGRVEDLERKVAELTAATVTHAAELAWVVLRLMTLETDVAKMRSVLETIGRGL